MQRKYYVDWWRWAERRRVRRPAVIIVACLALFAGVFAARHWPSPGGRWLWGLLPLVGWSVRRQTLLTVSMVALLCAGLGWWRGSTLLRQLAPYQQLARQAITLTGRATEDGVYGKYAQLTFGLDQLTIIQPVRRALPGQITVAGFGAMAVYRGDIIEVTGKLYPTRGNSQATVSFADVTVLARDRSPVNTLRRRFAAGLESALPEPQASFGLGLLIGQRSTLPADTSQLLLTVGLTHIIAVSGYNLTIMVDAARRLFGRRSKFQMTVACLTLIGLFLLLTGNSPSIVRASIISTLSIFTWYYGRRIPPLVLLLTAAAITVLANPSYIWGNVSWYLSFLAFCGVVLLAPLVKARLFGERALPLAVQILLESLCAELLTLPYVLYIFGQMSAVSLPANLVVAAFVPLAMLVSVVAGLAGMLLPSLAGWLAWPAHWLLSYMLQAAGLLARVPHAFIEGIGVSFGMMLAMYGMVALLMRSLRRAVDRQQLASRAAAPQAVRVNR